MNSNRVKIKTVVTGILVITAGVLLFLFNAGYLPLEYKRVVFSWQSLLVALGFIHLFSNHKQFVGLLLMGVGAFFLLPKLGIDRLTIITQNGWTIALIVVGIVILFRAVKRRNFVHQDWKTNNSNHYKDSREWKNYGNEPGYIDRNYVFGGSKEKISTKNFKGGDINCVFGGIELDLLDAELAEGTHLLELNAVFGGIVLYVPIDWNIEIRKSNVFGDFVDHRQKPSFEVDEKKILIIEVSSVLGGG